MKVLNNTKAMKLLFPVAKKKKTRGMKGKHNGKKRILVFK